MNSRLCKGFTDHSMVANQGFTTSTTSDDDFTGLRVFTGNLEALLFVVIIAVVLLVVLCVVVVLLRYKYHHKGSYHTNEAKGAEFVETAEAALKNDPSLREAMDESNKEYFA